MPLLPDELAAQQALFPQGKLGSATTAQPVAKICALAGLDRRQPFVPFGLVIVRSNTSIRLLTNQMRSSAHDANACTWR